MLVIVVPLGVAIVALMAIVMREARTRASGQPVKRPLYLTVVIGLFALLLTALFVITIVGLALPD